MITHEYIIPEISLAPLQKRIDKLNTKLEKAKLDPIEVVVGGFFDDIEDDSGMAIRLMNVTISATEPQVAGWQFVATLNHLSEGENVVLNISTQELPEMYRDRGPVCDHCKFTRKRRDTYVVRNVLTGEHTQVGRTCLRDFLGAVSAEKIADRAQWIADALALAEEAEKEKKEVRGMPLRSLGRWSLKMYLSFVAMTIRTSGGYISKRNAQDKGKASTASKAFDDMLEPHLYNRPSEDDKELADKAIEYFENLDTAEGLSEFDHNLNVIARSRFVQFKTLGYAAWMIPGFQKTQKAFVGFTRPEYVGTVNEKLQVTVTVKRVTEIENSFGFSWLHLLEDSNRNQLVWFCSTRANVLEVGQTVLINARVKQHREWQTRLQTVLTHVKKIKDVDTFDA